MIKKMRNFWRLRTDPPSTIFVPYNRVWVTRGVGHLGIWGSETKRKVLTSVWTNTDVEKRNLDIYLDKKMFEQTDVSV